MLIFCILGVINIDIIALDFGLKKLGALMEKVSVYMYVLFKKSIQYWSTYFVN